MRKYGLKKILYDNKAFLWPYLFVMVILLFVFLIVTKAELHLYINSFHSSSTDTLNKFITHLGDGISPYVLAFIFLFFSFRKSVIIAISGSLAGIAAQVLKRFVFAGSIRPIKYFEGIAQLHHVEGVDMHTSFSFPSGHSATIFSICFCLAAFTNNTQLKLALFILALIVAFSRVYLSQHFLVDIYAGSLIGNLSAIFVLHFFTNKKNEWMDKSLPIIITRKKKREE